MTAAFGVLLGRTVGRAAGIVSALLIVGGLARAAAKFTNVPFRSTIRAARQSTRRS